jgi:hypothetical protein
MGKTTLEPKVRKNGDTSFCNFNSKTKIPTVKKDGSGVFVIMAHKYSFVAEIRLSKNELGARAERDLMKKRHPGYQIDIFAFSGKEVF